METIYFLVGAVSVAVAFGMVWLLRVVSQQIKQIKQLENLTNSIVSNDITESQVRAIVDSRVDKLSDLIFREIEMVKKDLSQMDFDLDRNRIDEQEKIYRYIDDVKRDLSNQINNTRVTNTRRSTDGDLQFEY